MKLDRMVFGLAAAAVLASAGVANAAVPEATSVTSLRDNVAPNNVAAPLMTLTGVGPSTVNSVVMFGTGKNLSCVYNQASHTGTPGVTVAIQGVVPPGTGTPVGFSLLTSASVATDTSAVMTIGPGITAAANTAAQVVVPSLFRVQVVESGAGSTVTGTVTCTTSE
jgi:hypothetical protein